MCLSCFKDFWSEKFDGTQLQGRAIFQTADVTIAGYRFLESRDKELSKNLSLISVA